MTGVAPPVGQTVVTAGSVALVTVRGAGGADQRLTLGTALPAITAAFPGALRTGGGAIETEICLTAVAADQFISRVVPAITAFPTGPAVEGDIGAVRVVGVEDLPDEQEELEQPPLAERLQDRRPPLPFTQSLVLDVGMRGPGVGGSRVRVQGVDVVRDRCSQSVPAQADLEPAEVDPLQDDRPGLDGDGLFPQVEGDDVELRFEGFKVGIDLPDAEGDRSVGGGCERLPVPLQLVDQQADPHLDVAAALVGGHMPLSLVHQAPVGEGAPETFPVMLAGGERRMGTGLVPLQRRFDPERRPPAVSSRRCGH